MNPLAFASLALAEYRAQVATGRWGWNRLRIVVWSRYYSQQCAFDFDGGAS